MPLLIRLTNSLSSSEVGIFKINPSFFSCPLIFRIFFLKALRHLLSDLCYLATLNEAPCILIKIVETEISIQIMLLKQKIFDLQSNALGATLTL